jgi:hypothetical protein
MIQNMDVTRFATGFIVLSCMLLYVQDCQEKWFQIYFTIIGNLAPKDESYLYLVGSYSFMCIALGGQACSFNVETQDWTFQPWKNMFEWWMDKGYFAQIK